MAEILFNNNTRKRKISFLRKGLFCFFGAMKGKFITLIYCILLVILPFLCNAQDTLNNKKTSNHFSIQSYLGFRFVDQEIPYSSSFGLGASYQIKNHVISFRYLSRIKNINCTKDLLPVNTLLMPDETIWEIGILYRLFKNKKETASLSAGLSLIEGFNQGQLIYQPKTYHLIFEKKDFKDIGIPLELQYQISGTQNHVGKIYVCSIANINAIKSYAGIMLLFQLTF